MAVSSPQHPQPEAPHHVPHPHLSRRRHLRNVLLAGLLILTPLYVTAYVLWVLFHFMDGIFAPLIDRTLSVLLDRPGIHIPGLGLLLTLLVVLFLGWLSTLVVGRQIIESAESLIRRIPIAKSVYGATKGVLEAVSRDQADAFKRVVLVEYPRRGLFGIGFVTSGGTRWPSDDPRMNEELVPVFVPTTPNPTSGYLLMVPPAEIIECAISVEDGIRMVVSGGILQPGVLSAPQPAPSAPPEEAVAAAGTLGPAREF